VLTFAFELLETAGHHRQPSLSITLPGSCSATADCEPGCNSPPMRWPPGLCRVNALGVVRPRWCTRALMRWRGLKSRGMRWHAQTGYWAGELSHGHHVCPAPPPSPHAHTPPHHPHPHHYSHTPNHRSHVFSPREPLCFCIPCCTVCQSVSFQVTGRVQVHVQL